MGDEKRQVLLPLPPGSHRELRRWASVWMTRHQVEGVDPHDVLLCLTELVSNAERHGSGPVQVQLARAASRGLVLGVTDSSHQLPHQRLPSADYAGGRGMTIVDELATRWGVRREAAKERLRREYEATCAAYGTDISDLAQVIVRRSA